MINIILLFLLIVYSEGLETRDDVPAAGIQGNNLHFSNSVMLTGLENGTTLQINLNRLNKWELSDIINTDSNDKIIDFKNGKYVVLDTSVGKISIYTMSNQRSQLNGEISIQGSRIVAASQPIVGNKIVVLSERTSSKRLTLDIYEVTDMVVLKSTFDIGIPLVQVNSFSMCVSPAGKFIHVEYSGLYTLFKYEDGVIRKTSERTRPQIHGISCSDNSFTYIDEKGDVIIGETFQDNLITNTFFDTSDVTTIAKVFNSLLFIGEGKKGDVKVYKKTILNDISYKWVFLTKFTSDIGFKSMEVDVDYESVFLGYDDRIVVHSGFSTRDLLSCPAKNDISKDVMKNIFTGVCTSFYGTSVIILLLSLFTGKNNYKKVKTNSIALGF